MAAVMQEPFPVLKSLSITRLHENVLDIPIPRGFLGGYAPCLQRLELGGVSFPALPTLLLSASDLVELILRDIPQTGYISPEVMVEHLAALPRFNTLHIAFRSLISHPALLLPPAKTRTLPALHDLLYEGVSDYLEDFMARIDTPELDSLVINYLRADVNFEVPQLCKFINRSEGLNQIMSDQCRLVVNHEVIFSIFCVTSNPEPYISVRIRPKWNNVYYQFFQLVHVISSLSPILFDMDHLIIDSDALLTDPLEEVVECLGHIEQTEWLELFRPFSSVRSIFVSWQLVGHFSRALKDVDAVMVTEVLPALSLLCLQYSEYRPATFLDNFLTARQDSGHPVTVVGTERAFDRRLESLMQQGKAS